jgi:hypothetical protein
MPIRKFRSVEEMNQPVWREPGSPELFRAIREVWDFGRRTSKRRFRPGVYRYRSIEEMQQGERWIASEGDEL